jgi:hypothetical protein
VIPGNGTRKTPDDGDRPHYFDDREFYRRACLRLGGRVHDDSGILTRIKEPEFQPSSVGESDDYSRCADRSFQSHYFLREIRGFTQHCLASLSWSDQCLG